LIQLIKNIFFKFLFFCYKVLVKNKVKDRKTLPRNFVDNIYEIFLTFSNQGNAKKIILPYDEVNNFNRHNLEKPFEVLYIDFIERNTSKNLKLDRTKDFILPIAILDQTNNDDRNKIINLSFDNKKVKIELRYKNRFHYLPIKPSSKIDTINIASEECSLAVGRPFYNDSKELLDKPKLIVHIFVDALSKVILDSASEEIMPNTYNFFSNGTIFENAYSQADWTLSSMSGVFTGKYSKDHLIFDPRRGDKIHDITLAEILKNEGYITSSISSIPKLTPLNGFDKGFDRCVIAPDKDSSYIINEAIEQLDSFKGNQYLFVGFFDIHEAYKLQPISSQVSNNLEDFVYRQIRKEKGLSILFDKERLNSCVNTIKHFDSKLENLYHKINEYDSNATVVLHSDHGVDFIASNTQRLSKEREKVAFMIKGNNIESSKDPSIKEIREIPSMLLKSANIKDKIKYHNNGYAITESIYPNQDYELSIRSNKYVLFFQVPWNIFNQRLILDNNYNFSFHDINDENTAISHNNNFDIMHNMALDHYGNLIKNLIESYD